MSNERLRGAIADANVTIGTLAEKVGVDPKTVERWITRQRVPHPSHRRGVVAVLGVDETFLWPALLHNARAQSASRAELIEFYPSRSAVPAGMWARLSDNAVECLDFLAYAALGTVEQGNLVERFVARRDAGVRIRVLLGDPAGRMIAQRAREEGQGGTVTARASLSLGYFRDAASGPGLEVRIHDTCLYTSIFRADNDLLANTHVYGSPAAASPVLHLHRVPGGRVFDHYMRSFERVWDSGTPIADTYQIPGT